MSELNEEEEEKFDQEEEVKHSVPDDDVQVVDHFEQISLKEKFLRTISNFRLSELS